MNDDREMIIPSQGVVVGELSILSANEVSNRLHAARQEGYRQAIADLRDRGAYEVWLRSNRQWSVPFEGPAVRDHFADFLESRITGAPKGESA